MDLDFVKKALTVYDALFGPRDLKIQTNKRKSGYSIEAFEGPN
jgi:hypothetical protein